MEMMRAQPCRRDDEKQEAGRPQARRAQTAALLGDHAHGLQPCLSRIAGVISYDGGQSTAQTPRHSQVCGGMCDRLPPTPRSVSGDAEDDM